MLNKKMLNFTKTYFNQGKHCCLFCHITKDQLRIPPSERGKSEPRTLETLDRDFETFTKEFDGDLKKAKFANNIISSRIFNIPIDQVKFK